MFSEKYSIYCVKNREIYNIYEFNRIDILYFEESIAILYNENEIVYNIVQYILY